MRAFLLGSAVTLFAGTAAFAADLGQYRPGNPYQSVIAPGADVCESHCAGDAQCRSWNYIKANPQAAGVCEFNANDVAPVASAISISGVSSAAPYRSGVVAGGTNTIRVGTQTASRPQATKQRTSPTRRIVREPVPQRRQAQTASTRPIVRQVNPANPGSLTAQQNQYRQAQPSQAQPSQARRATPQNPQQTRQTAAIPQSFKYDLGGGQMVAPRGQVQQRPVQAPQIRQPQISPRGYAAQPPRHQAPTTARDRRRQQGPNVQRGAQLPHQAMPQQGQAYPPQAQAPLNLQAPASQQAMAPTSPMARRSANQPMTYQAGPVPPQAPQQTSPQNLAQGLTAEQAQRSLFGKLNDDVRVPNSGASVPADPNAPIATAASRPTLPVEQSQLGELAGAPRQ